MRNILVTGGAGFIGSNFVRYMLEKHPDYRVVVYDKLTYAGNLDNLREVEDDPRYAFVRGDICDAETVERVMREHQIDAIVNFAAESHVDRSILEPGSFILTDVYGAYVLLEAARKFGVERMVQVSSVTGDTPILVRDEPTGEIRLRLIEELDGEDVTRYSVLTMTDDYQVKFQRIGRFIKHRAEELYEIKFNGGGRIKVTASHSVFVFDGDKIIAKPSCELREGDLLITFVGDVLAKAKKPHVFDLKEILKDYSAQQVKMGVKRREAILRSLCMGPKRFKELREVVGRSPADLLRSLKAGGYIEKSNGQYSITQLGIRSLLTGMQDIKWDLTKRKLHIKRDTLEVSPLLMEIFGLYLAEGHCSHTEKELSENLRTVVFTVSGEEELAKLRRCAKEIFNIHACVKERSSSYQLQYSSYWVHALFSQFGATAETKRLPGWIWTQPKELIEAFFRGYEGDAAVKADGRRYHTSVNRSLIESLLWLARLNDINALFSSRITKQVKGKVPPHITVTREREFYDLQITAESVRRGESRRWRTPMARCIPTEAVTNIMGYHQHKKVSVGRKRLVSKERAAEFCATFDDSVVPKKLWQLIKSSIGVAKIKSIRKLQGDFTVYDVSVPGNERFFGGNVPVLLHNTDEVYGSIEKGSFKEIDPLSPSSPYSASKAGGDLIARAYYKTFGVPAIITRGSNTFGPFQYPEKVIPLFITNAIDDLPLPLYGDGLNVRDWIYVLDHCEAIDIVLHKGTPGEIYNIGAGNELPNIELTKLILKLLGKSESLIQYVKDRPGHDRRYSLNCSKIKALGWRCRYNFEEALERTVKWYVENEWWWRKIKSGEYWEYYRRQYEGLARIDE